MSSDNVVHFEDFQARAKVNTVFAKYKNCLHQLRVLSKLNIESLSSSEPIINRQALSNSIRQMRDETQKATKLCEKVLDEL